MDRDLSLRDHEDALRGGTPVGIVLATPPSVGTLTDPAGRFPDITTEGTELTEEQAQAAGQVAQHMNFKFRVVRGGEQQDA